MLVDFSLTNFGPFRDRVTLSMQATADTEHPGNVIPSSVVHGGLLSSVAIFGANSSGKSSVINGLRSLKSMLSGIYEEGFRYPWFNPFRLSAGSLGSPTEFEIRLVSDDVLYDYSISFTADRVVHESLFHYPKKRRVCYFERGGGSSKNINTAIDGLTTSGTPYLTVGSKFNDGICNTVRNSILEIFIVSDENDIGSTLRLIADDPDMKETVIDALGAADFGIKGFRHETSNIDPSSIRGMIPPDMYDAVVKENTPVFADKVWMEHDFEDCDVGEDMLRFPMHLESKGTVRMFGIVGPLAYCIGTGRTVVIDEFGSYMHSSLTRWIAGLFGNDTNPKHAQLIVSTHDLGLMDIKNLLRRDQIVFANKDRGCGASELYALSDFKGVRKDTDVLGAYLLGRYDAVPNMRSGRMIR